MTVMLGKMLFILIFAVSVFLQNCFYSWGGVFLVTIPGPYNTDAINSACGASTTVSPVYSTITTSSSFTVSIPTDTSSFSTYIVTTTFTTTIATGLETWSGVLASASLLPASYVMGNCVLNGANQGMIGTRAWVGPFQISTSVGGNGLTTNYCPILENIRDTVASGYLPTFTMVNCDVDLFPYLCAFQVASTQTVTLLVPTTIFTTTITAGSSTVTRPETITSIYSTNYLSTTTTTRTSTSTISTETEALPVSTSTTILTATPSTKTTSTSTFTFFDTSFAIITVGLTDTITIISTFTKYTTTESQLSTETFCSAREPIDP